MKKVIYVALFLSFIVSGVHSQKLIALQNGSKVYINSKIDSILLHAADGDTIYFPGFSYNQSITLEKRLTIYGTGHYSDSALVSRPTRIYGNLTLKSGASGSSIEGIDIEGSITIATNETVSSFTFMRSKVNDVNLSTAGIGSDGFHIQESVIMGTITGSTNLTNLFVEKSIVQGYIQALQNFSLIKNSILLYNGCGNCSGGHTSNFYQSSGVDITSCIMIGSYINYPNSCVFSNNLICGSPVLTSPNIGNNVGYAFASIFKYIKTGTNNLFDYNNDYQLQDACVGKSAGLDGTDVGIYGTSTPYKAIPSTPFIENMQNADQTKNGKLGIDMTVKAQSR